METNVLREISKHLETKKYEKGDLIIEAGKPVEMIFIIVEGRVIIEMKDSSVKRELGAEKVYGEKLLSCPAYISKESATAVNDVVVLVLKGTDVEKIKCEHELHYIEDTTDWDVLTIERVALLRKVSN